MTQEPPMSLDAMVKQLSEGIKAAKHTLNMHTYDPTDKQLAFHKAPNRGRMFIGGNRSGKTVAGAMEAIWWITRNHPYRPIPEWQIEGRCVSVDFTNGVEMITKPEIKRWLPPSFLINGSWEDSYDRVSRTLTLANGNYLEFKSYDQDLDKHAGTARDFVWFDEEPPQSIYEENFIRLTSKNGLWWLTMTPVEGATWTLTDLYEPALEGLKNIFVIEVNVSENKHLDQAVVDDIFGELSKEEQIKRRQGKYVHGAGLIFPQFTKNHIISKMPFDPRRPPYRIVTSVDLGLNAPTAWLWHALTPDGDVFTFHEMSKSGWTIPQFAKYVHEYEARTGIRKVWRRVGDPAAKQRSRQTGISDHLAYANAGLPFALGNNEWMPGINKMRDYLEDKRWYVHESCGTLIKELRKYRFKEWDTRKMKDKNNPRDEPHKKDDHSIDSTRYMFSILPELALLPNKQRMDRIKYVNEQARKHLGIMTAVDDDNIIDTSRDVPADYTHLAYDDMIGEF